MPPAAGEHAAEPSPTVESPAVPEGVFVKAGPNDHPLSRACEVAVYFQDYGRHLRTSSQAGGL